MSSSFEAFNDLKTKKKRIVDRDIGSHLKELVKMAEKAKGTTEHPKI
jgi:hypothetical protein